jgi:putative endonuclease
MRERRMDTKRLGRFGEEAAAKYLKKERYRLLGMNYRTRYGELDLIVCDRRFVVFVEVKLRRSAAFAEAREFVTRRKQERVIAAAQTWLQNNPTLLQPRFDVIEVYAPRGEDPDCVEIHHIENAFTKMG